MVRKRDRKVCFAASSGGHFEQIMMLKPLMEQYNGFIVTEKTGYEIETKFPVYKVSQINRKEKIFPLKMVYEVLVSLYIFIKERPDTIVTTGALAMVPLCLICKVFRRKLIYIESFAKVSTPTETGKLMYHFADRFYVQWKSMLAVYPNASYVGGIY